MLLVAAIPVHAQLNHTVITFNVGDFGVGWNFPLNDRFNTESYFSLLNFGLENDNINLGFSFSLVKVHGWSESGWGENNGAAQSDVEAISLFNLNLYWNAVNSAPADISFYLGPFASINYFFLDDTVNWGKSIFTAGIHMGLRLSGRQIDYNLLSAEMGYRRINGSNRYHIGARIDLVALATILVMVFVSRTNEDNGSRN